MYAVKVKGGLGNQLFAYAFGNHLTNVASKDVKFDMSYFKNDTRLGHEKDYLSELFPNLEMAETHYIPKYYPPRSSRFDNLGPKMFSYIPRVQSILKNKFGIVWESPFPPGKGNGPVNMHYYDFSQFSQDDLYFVGNWICAKYPLQNKTTVAENLKIQYESESFDSQIINHLKNSESVSVHVRKSDNDLGSRIPIDWHVNAMEQMARRLHNPKFFVFSNDINWAMTKLEGCKLPIIKAESGGNSACEILNLMSNCKHNIVSASTFSWWGGFLNNNPDKAVYAPSFWPNTSDVKSTDLYPPNWTII